MFFHSCDSLDIFIRFKITGNRTPGHRLAVHYTTAAQRQLHAHHTDAGSCFLALRVYLHRTRQRQIDGVSIV